MKKYAFWFLPTLKYDRVNLTLQRIFFGLFVVSRLEFHTLFLSFQGVPTKSEKKAQKKSLSKAEVKTPKGNESVTSSSQSPKKQSMEGGVIVEELKPGNGPVAKPGKMVSVLKNLVAF